MEANVSSLRWKNFFLKLFWFVTVLVVWVACFCFFFLSEWPIWRAYSLSSCTSVKRQYLCKAFFQGPVGTNCPTGPEHAPLGPHSPAHGPRSPFKPSSGPPGAGCAAPQEAQARARRPCGSSLAGSALLLPRAHGPAQQPLDLTWPDLWVGFPAWPSACLCHGPAGQPRPRAALLHPSVPGPWLLRPLPCPLPAGSQLLVTPRASGSGCSQTRSVWLSLHWEMEASQLLWILGPVCAFSEGKKRGRGKQKCVFPPSESTRCF